MSTPDTTRAPEIQDVELEDGLLGDYDPVSHLIRLDPRQPGWQYRSSLEHEWVHSLRRDELTGDAVLDARIELAAEREAACRLVSLGDLVNALWWSDSLCELAELLDVDPAIVVARIQSLSVAEQRLIADRLELSGRWTA